METLTLLLLLLLNTCLCQNINNIFEEINKETTTFNAVAADIAWESSINPGNPELPEKSAAYQKKRIVWQHQTCNKLGKLYNRQFLNDTQRRQSYLLCRGPKFTFREARLTSNLYEELQSIYADAEVCIPNAGNTSITNLSDVEDAILNYLSNVRHFLNLERENYILFAAKIAVNSNTQENKLCLKGESDFDKMMAFSRREEVLRWLWLAWREKVGPPMKAPYRRLANVENQAARRNGYPNIGASWRDELEMPRLRQKCRHLYYSIQHLYRLLHGVVRYYLRRYYGEIVPKRGPIPAHLLGNLWSQNWEPLATLILPSDIDLDESIKELNWTVNHMVKRAEDFYQSLGLSAMTDKFWRASVFARENSDARCHGTAADMFKDGDYRLLYCSETSKEDFYVLHHELGHIQYYMAYEHQPALFRQANTALHETIGDTIMYGVLTPQHLNRLGLINDTLLYRSDAAATYLFKDDPINTKHTKDKDNVLNEKTVQVNIQNKRNIKNKDMNKVAGTNNIPDKNNNNILKETNDNISTRRKRNDKCEDLNKIRANNNKPNIQATKQHVAKDIDNVLKDDNVKINIRKKRSIKYKEINKITDNNNISKTQDTKPNLSKDKDTILKENNFTTNVRTKRNTKYGDINKITENKYKDFDYDKVNDISELSKADDVFFNLEDADLTSNVKNKVLFAPELFNSKDITTDNILLFRLALNKISQIPFALAIDEYRWKYFEGSLEKDRENKEFWDLVKELQGIAPVGERGEEYFDAGAKFHVPDNTPYIRYFLSSFLQHQLFEKLCKAAVFGHRNAEGPVPDTISLNRCDIYGSKSAGKVLKDLMSRGHSQHWSEILQTTVGESDISATALIKYYQPLYQLLDRFVRQHRIPVGW